MNEPLRYAALVAELAQGLFGWWIVILVLLWNVVHVSDAERWQRWLRNGLWVGIVGCALALTTFGAWCLQQAFSPDPEVRAALMARCSGPYAWGFWLSLFGHVLMVAVLVMAHARASWWLAWAVALLMSLPFERLVILITSLHRDYLPSSWKMYQQAVLHLVAPIALLLSALLMAWAQRRAGAQDGKA